MFTRFAAIISLIAQQTHMRTRSYDLKSLKISGLGNDVTARNHLGWIMERAWMLREINISDDLRFNEV